MRVVMLPAIVETLYFLGLLSIDSVKYSSFSILLSLLALMTIFLHFCPLFELQKRSGCFLYEVIFAFPTLCSGIIYTKLDPNFLRGVISANFEPNFLSF